MTATGRKINKDAMRVREMQLKRDPGAHQAVHFHPLKGFILFLKATRKPLGGFNQGNSHICIV